MILDFEDRCALQIETEVFYSGEAFYRSIQEQCPYDLVFLDIQLLEMDGVQVGRKIREQLGNDKISIVYISSKGTYSMSLFQVRPMEIGNPFMLKFYWILINSTACLSSSRRNSATVTPAL